MLVLTGEKASGQTLITQAKLVDTNVEGVIIKGSGHWLMEEATEQVVPKLVEFLTTSNAPFARRATWICGLKGKRALVTGSTAGIGLAAARALAAEGAVVT